jgi:hypothetical protein
LGTFDSRFDRGGDLPHLAEGKFSDLYLKMVQALVFDFSSVDKELMDKEETAAEAQIAEVIEAYKNAGFPIPEPLPPETPNTFMYITNFLAKTYGDLDDIPDSLNTLRNALASYKEMANDSYILHQNAGIARKRLTDAKQTISKPTAANGGLKTDADSYYPGYDKLSNASKLVASLQQASNTITLSIHADTFSETQSHLVINNDFSVSVPLAFIFKVSVEHQSTYTLDTFVSSDNTLDIDIAYPGITLVSAEPLAQSPDGTKGWFDLTMIREAAQKSGADAIGYQLHGSEFDPK